MSEFKIHCVRISTATNFDNNLLQQQFILRRRILVDVKKWKNIFVENGMEFDRYDNPATEYFIATNSDGEVVGTIRTHPTTIPYMLSDVFPFLVSRQPQSSKKIHELSRLVCDTKKLNSEETKQVVTLLFAASVERGMQRNINVYVGFVEDYISENVFIPNGWSVIRSSTKFRMDGIKVYGVILPVGNETLVRMKRHLCEMGIEFGGSLLDFGRGSGDENKDSPKFSPGTKVFKWYSFVSIIRRLYVVYFIIVNRMHLHFGKTKSHYPFKD